MVKKKSGKGKSGKGKKGKKGDDEQMSIREAILAYQINIKEKLLEDLNFEIESLQKKIEKGKERNTKLREEQMGHLQHVVGEMRTEEANDTRDPITGRARIEEALHDLWLTDQNQTKEVLELKRHIMELDNEIGVEKVVFDKWTDYKEYGQHEDSHRVSLLEQELGDNQNTFDEQSKFHREDLDKSKRDVGTAAEKTVENVKSGAAEKAMGQLDKKERREITDHSWLKQESVRYKEEVEILEAEVRMLEEQNLALMSYLFECRLEDLNISSWFSPTQQKEATKDRSDKKFFLTQFDNDAVIDNLKGSQGIIEQDLIINHPLLRPSPDAPQLAFSQSQSFGQNSVTGEVKFMDQSLIIKEESQGGVDDQTSGYSTFPPQSFMGTTTGTESTHQRMGRPKSATLQAIQEKVQSYETMDEEGEEDEGIEAGDEVHPELGYRRAGDALTDNLLDNYFSLEDDTNDEYLKLGPLELKMLQVTGARIPIRARTPPTQEELDLQVYNPNEWPVTNSMLQDFQLKSFHENVAADPSAESAGNMSKPSASQEPMVQEPSLNLTASSHVGGGEHRLSHAQVTVGSSAPQVSRRSSQINELNEA